MISFVNDYSEGACDEILRKMLESNRQQNSGYGVDAHCEQAAAAIRQAIGDPSCDVHFLVGGTQCNKTVIAGALRPHEAVIAVNSGHINVHETGAIESSGHKVIAMPGENGLLRPCDIEEALRIHTDEHMVKPKMVYLSNASELGTYYTKRELRAIHRLCQRHGLYLFLDGARLGNALCAVHNDLTLRDLPQLCDVFYIGGTKNGALFGEALVIKNEVLKTDFRYHIKQNGGLLAKGWLLGIQFATLFSDDLYLRLAKHANDAAQQIAACLKECGVKMLLESETNQIFPILDNRALAKLREHFLLGDWEVIDRKHTAIRIVTSWATGKEAVDAFCEQAGMLLKGKQTLGKRKANKALFKNRKFDEVCSARDLAK